jgi:hypothetical protein
MKNRFWAISLLLLGFTIAGANIIADPLENILARLKKYSSSYPQEKVHLHLDKPVYAAGDTIWLKAYIVNAEMNQLSNISKVLYVDLLDDVDSVKQSIKLPVDAGLSWGNITLADTVKEGNYHIRAYTNWMRNFDAAFFFDKTIKIGSAFSNRLDAAINFTVPANRQQVKANIVYNDADGIPYKEKPVNYEIYLESGRVSSKKGVTDDNGNLLVDVPLSTITRGTKYIVTHLTVDDRTVLNKSFPITLVSAGADLQFFPEGGNLINGIKSKVAFKAIGVDGKGITVSGSITDSHGAAVTDFKTEHAGMGAFSFKPQAGETYKASVKFNDGSVTSYNLPVAQAGGYVLAVDNEAADKLKIHITIGDTRPDAGQITVVAHMNGIIKYASKAAIDANTLDAEISKDRFSTGILHITLFSSAGMPLAERLVFIDHGHPLGLKLQTDKQTYQTREKTKMQVTVTDEAGQPAVGSFSVAVTDDSKVQANELDEQTILSNLLLTSDLKGYVEQPNYYFINPNTTTAKHLDLLMLTQGWSRFVWKDVLADKFAKLPFTAENGLEISGKVSRNYGNGVADVKVSLNSLPGNKAVADTTTTNQGTFKFDKLFFIDTGKFLLLGLTKKGNNNLMVTVNKPSAVVSSGKQKRVDLDANVSVTIKKYVQNSKQQFDEWEKSGVYKRTIMLKEVKIKERKLTKLQEAVAPSANFNGPGNADKVITYADLRNYHEIMSALQAKVPGVTFRRNSQNDIIAMSNRYHGQMLVVVDGVPNTIPLNQIDVHNIQSIEVLLSGGLLAVYGRTGSGGVLVITTKQGGIDYGDESEFENAKGFIYYNFMGYHVIKEFYSPVYNSSANNNPKDLRTTIYWNPNILTDKNGKASFEYYNADGTGNYKAIIEGITADGKPGRLVTTYTVQ